MNSLIKQLFDGFTVGGVAIPVSFLFYAGHGEPYVVYSMVDADTEFSANDELQAYCEYYDFDVYSRGNYFDICEAVIGILEDAGFRFEPSRSSGDLYDPDTEYFHKTLNFQIIKEV